MKRHCKLIISTITMALIFTLFIHPVSYAQVPQRFGAWIASALTALNIVTNSTIAPYYDFVDDYLTDPFMVNEQSSAWDYIPYTWDDSDEIMERSVLKIDKDKITIDGVDYTDIWLSTDAAEKFRTNAFDLISAFNIASQSDGTFVSGEGYIDGSPVYKSGNTYRTQNKIVEFTAGDYRIFDHCDIVVDNGNTRSLRQVGWGYDAYLTGFLPSSSYPFRFWATTNEGFTSGDLWYRGPTSSYNLSAGDPPSNLLLKQAFDFDWVASDVPADVALSSEGLRVRVPTDEINQWYQDYPDTGPNVTINMGDPELTQKVDDLIDLIIPLIPVLDIDFIDYDAPEPEPIPEPIPEPDPYPDPDPQPGTVITDLDWTDLFQTIKNIFNKISEQVSISSAIKNILDKIKWFTDDFFENIGDILGDLPDIFERHVIETIRRGLTGLKNIFLPVIARLRNALGIWHYVVEWFQAISTPFIFYLSLISQGYPLITLPIYASIAGIIVIAVYRRFGR